MLPQSWFNYHFLGNIDTGYIVLDREDVGSASADLLISGYDIVDSELIRKNLKITLSKCWWIMHEMSIILAV